MKKLFSPLFALVALFTFATAQAAELQPETIDAAKTISAEELLDLVDQLDDLVIIDARGQGDYDKGHIPDVVRIKNDDVTADSLAAAVPSKNTPVVFYCNGVKCGRSADAASKAKAAGYTNLFWFRGGIAEWQEKGYPVEM
ncbi:rhodanese-like domain-containing protein [Motiliproteus sediminis]|uniref:rhodanese-like domain-containing protein n=1 Tax=Motiliproteus sediminis TaxID=1468178 RepID=UPI001AEFC768|nr:rhodanese-like domain-containing protein [Motiliproteus sediminis]